MTKSIDETDLQILAELDLNARTSNTKIARRLDMNKNTVGSRIREMEENGIIKGYFSFIDFFKLGYQSYRIYLKLQYASSKTEKEMMNYLNDSVLTRFCSYAKGKFDLSTTFWFGNLDPVERLWNDFLKKYKPHIKKVIIAPFCGEVKSSHPFTKRLKSCSPEKIHKEAEDAVIGEKGFLKIPRTGSSASSQCDYYHINIDEKDRSILRILSDNARTPLHKIGEAVGLSSATVRYRIGQLVEKKVIKAFRPLIKMEKLGYTSYRVDLNLNSLENQKKIEEYILKKANVCSVIKTIGGADLETRLYVKNSKELYSILHEIRDEFSDEIQDYDFFAYPDILKESYVPAF